MPHLIDFAPLPPVQELRALEDYLGVAKRIVLCLVRKHPQDTVDGLQRKLGELVSRQFATWVHL